MRQPNINRKFNLGRMFRGLVLASGFAFGPVQMAHAAPTKAECLERAQADYDNAVQACHSWASDPDPYITCLNDAAFAHQSAYQKCQRIIKRPPALSSADKPTQRATSR